MKTALIVFAFTLSFLLFPVKGLAQYQKYDLSEYKLPDIKTSRLDLNFNANMNHSSTSSDLSGFNNQLQKLNRYGGMMDATFYNFKNSLNYQGSQTIELEVLPNWQSARTKTDTTKNGQLNAYLSMNSSNRFYNRNGSFIEIMGSFDYNGYTITDRRGEVAGKAVEKSNIFSVSAPLSVGHGRIEPVEDARLAVYIIEDLSKNGKVENIPSDAVITELAREISKIKRKRFFDSRIRRIEELQVMDSFLVANSITSSNDIVYFTSLADQWDYASGPSRKTGFSFNAGFDNGMKLDKFIESRPVYNTALNEYVYFNDTTISNVYNAGAFARIDFSKPLNLYWQSDLSFLSSCNYEFTRDPSDRGGILTNFDTRIFFASVNYSIRFLPNSRTSVGLTAGGYYRSSSGTRYRVNLLPVKGDMISNDFSVNTSVDMYYYFSPQLRITLNWNLNSQGHGSVTKFESTYSDLSIKQNYFSHNFVIGFIYSFF